MPEICSDEQIRVPANTKVVEWTHGCWPTPSISTPDQWYARCKWERMEISRVRIVFVLGILSAAKAHGQTVGVIRSRPLPSPLELSTLESRVLQNPEDMDARIELLQDYSDMTPAPAYDNPARRSVRLQHILYLVEHHPEAAASASRVAYVYRSKGAYANAGDHDAVRHQWLAAVQAHPTDRAVVMNAVKFLNVEDPEDAEEALRRAVAADPADREIAANLGFQYAMEILETAPDIASHATEELDQSSNAIVLAAAGTALPNMAMRASAGRTVDPKIFTLASELAARARKLAPDDADIQGPLPLIKYFSAFTAH
jgi:tetratricopeptide (TPR) repeat protein